MTVVSRNKRVRGVSGGEVALIGLGVAAVLFVMSKPKTTTTSTNVSRPPTTTQPNGTTAVDVALIAAGAGLASDLLDNLLN